MSDIIFTYFTPVTTFDTATRMPPTVGVPVGGDDLLMIDGSSFVLLIDGSTHIGLVL
jgi:hypothetical protein